MTKVEDEDDYGFSSGDEADLVELTDAVVSASKTHKRKASSEIVSAVSKKLATGGAPKIFQSALSALKSNFGYDAFRLKQEQAISRILSGQSAVVVFPTGGGKSLCFQIPALAFEEEDRLTKARPEGEGGITLVVSPLIALMKDQVDALVRRNIAAAVLDSTRTREQFLEINERLRNGQLKILYCAPERLNNEGFVEQMKYVRGGIRLLAVDEAHCISEWGHSFRPDYLKISRFAKEINAERVVCLTATATPRVAEDICNAFDIDKSGLFRTTTYRPNLHLMAQSGATKNDMFLKLFAFLRKTKGASIVYVTLQKHTEQLAAILTGEGFVARAFHAGLGKDIKTNLQDEFMRRDDMVIVATIAFGMGIDKDAIRNVVHFCVPMSLESYSQEIGRAGRDGKPSQCMFYVCGEDLHLREIFALGDLPSRESIRRLLKDIFNSTNVKIPVGGYLEAYHPTQENDFDIKGVTLKNIYTQLELTHNLLRATTPKYQDYSFKADESKYKAKAKYDKSPTAQAIHKFSFKKKNYSFDMEAAIRSLKLTRNDLVHKLNDWHDEGTIELKTSGVVNMYKVIQALPKTSGELETIGSKIYTLLRDREQQSLDRTEQMMGLITGKECFSKVLAQHFDDDLPDGKSECGHCQWCTSHEAVKIILPPPIPFNKEAFKRVLDKVEKRDDPRFLARVAFGITSPRVTKMKLGRDQVFASMDDHKFSDLLTAFEKVCKK